MFKFFSNFPKNKKVFGRNGQKFLTKRFLRHISDSPKIKGAEWQLSPLFSPPLQDASNNKNYCPLLHHSVYGTTVTLGNRFFAQPKFERCMAFGRMRYGRRTLATAGFLVCSDVTRDVALSSSSSSKDVVASWKKLCF